ncbi:hypothetical protein GCM10018954_031100 [Kutzneria kofuensis]
MLLPALADPTDAEAIVFGDRKLTYRELAGTASAIAKRLVGDRVAVWATPTIETCAAVVGALAAGVAVVPVNPKVGERELEHILGDSAPAQVLAAPGVELPGGLASLPRLDVDLSVRDEGLPPEPDAEAPAFIVYTSGTTGPPKGVVMPRRAIASNLDSLAAAWEWTAADVVTHALPIFHVHGLVVGVLGPLRRGGAVHHLGKFSSAAAAAELAGPATMMFGVPTMYHRLAADVEADPELAKQVAQARLLVSGSAALPATCHERISKATGQRIVERYGMTETLMNCSVRAWGRAPARHRRHPGRRRGRAARGRRRRGRLRQRRRHHRRDRGPWPEPVPGVPQPPRRDRRGDARRLVPHRRHGHPRPGRLHPDRRPAGHRHHQERRLQDRRR